MFLWKIIEEKKYRLEQQYWLILVESCLCKLKVLTMMLPVRGGDSFHSCCCCMNSSLDRNSFFSWRLSERWLSVDANQCNTTGYSDTHHLWRRSKVKASQWCYHNWYVKWKVNGGWWERRKIVANCCLSCSSSCHSMASVFSKHLVYCSVIKFALLLPQSHTESHSWTCKEKIALCKN